MARTGEGSRVFPLQIPGAGCLIGGFNVLLNVMALCGLLTLLGFGLTGVATLLDPDASLYRLSRQPNAAERAQGERRISVVGGVINGTTGPNSVPAPGTPEYCVVIHEYYVSGKNGGWRRDNTWYYAAQGAHVVSAGQTFTLDWRPHTWRFSPEEWSAAEEFRGNLYGVPSGGRMRSQCLREGDRAFLDAFERTPGRLEGDTGRNAVVTVGSGTAQARIDGEAVDLGWRLGWFAASLLFIGLWLRNLVKARPVVEVLAAMSRAKPLAATHEGPLLGVTIVGTIAAMIIDGVSQTPGGAVDSAFRSYHTGLCFLVGTALLSATAAVWLGARTALLQRAMDTVYTTPQGTLGAVWQGLVKLLVRVAPDAPTVHGGVAGMGKAFVQVDLAAFVPQGRSTNRVPICCLAFPQELPVVDATGTGRMNLQEVAADLPAVRKQYAHRKAAEVLGPYAHWSGDLTRHVYHSFEVEVSSLLPGDSIFVLGEAARVEDPKGHADYRMAATQALIRCAPGGRLVVHAGDEASLLAMLGREYRWAKGLRVAAFALAGVMTLATAWLAAQ